MPKRTALDVRLAIVDAYDSGALNGEMTAAEIAKAIGSTPRSVGKALMVIQFRMTQKRMTITERIPHRWQPPRRFPNLTARHSDLSHDIVGVFEDGDWTGRCYARDIAPLVESDERRVSAAFKRLGFKIVKRAHTKALGAKPAKFRPPLSWPPLIEKQRELRAAGLSVGQVEKATELAAEIEAILDAAEVKLAVEYIPLTQRGQMKAKIREVIADYHRAFKAKQLGQVRVVSGSMAGEHETVVLKSRLERLEEIQKDYYDLALKKIGETFDAPDFLLKVEDIDTLAEYCPSRMSAMLKVGKALSRQHEGVVPIGQAVRWVEENMDIV